MSYTDDYFRQLIPGEWYFIKDLPRMIGFSGFINALRDQILLPDFEIVVGKYYSTFKVIRTKAATMHAAEPISKAV
jgi:hypothetical protein